MTETHKQANEKLLEALKEWGLAMLSLGTAESGWVDGVASTKAGSVHVHMMLGRSGARLGVAVDPKS
jgi:hypothetical protein